MKKYTALTLIFFMIFSISFGQTKKEKKAAKSLKEYEQMKEVISGEAYDFQAEWATTLQGRRINLTSNANFMRIRKDSANIYLPYFGQSSSGGVAMTTNGGIEFSGLMQDYKVSYDDKKQKIVVQFNANSKNERYQFNMTVFKAGNTIMNVNSNYRTGIKYEGNTRKPKQE
ncbi:DUF4251 domain-containing protein [Lutimonas zeaxanthinifaciens]|uniref:DUF4251 domain-containing protein n=1 Tax=Lutimonas zeaxanthinifaciens TaxID=3060215 RepID=UPI00265D5968|nr:DUF4251 domain-containing protein [Lutimonas sp. YSD2104]WKK66408.1 DUF4251 domain-containing protein [Lutimonas sp. YSD2104]